MSNPAAPSANVKDQIKRGPRIEYSDIEDDVIDPTGQLTNKRGTGANGQKRNHGKTTPSTAAILTRKVSKDDPPTTSTTPKEVDLKDPKPQGQDSSGSSTAMSATNTNVQDNGNVLDSSNSSSDTQRNNTPTLTAVKTTDNDKTSDTSKTKADQKGDTPGTIASVEQDNGNVPDISNSSSGTQINNMSTLTAVVTHDNDKIYDISKTSVGNNTPDNILVANKVRANDDESVRTRHSVDKSIDASTMTDDNVSRDQTITNLGMTNDKPSSIDTNGETYPAVTLATDGVETKSWSNQQITYSLYTHVVIPVLVNIVCLCLVCWFLVPQLVPTPAPRSPDSKPLPTTYDPRIDELVKEVERLSRMQTEITASFDTCRTEVTEQIKAEAKQNDAIQSSLYIRMEEKVKEETTSRKRLESEIKETFSGMKTEIADIDARRVNQARELKNDIESLEGIHKSLRKQVEHIQEELKVVPGLQSKFENLANDAEIQESHMKSVIMILTTPDVGPLHIAVALLFMCVLYMWFRPSTINRQHHSVVHSVDRIEGEHVSRHQPSILERVAVPGRLDNTVCILGFYKSTLELRTRLTQSVLEPGIDQTHFLLDNHEDILRLPPCRLFLVFVDINERHVILEDPSLGLGDLRVTTVRALEKMGASMVVIYYGDHESRNIGDHLFNRRLTSVQHQSELSALCKRDRFFSTANTFTDRQIHALKKAVAAEIN